VSSQKVTGHRTGLLARAAQTIRRGGIVAYPTESCYGFGCDPGNIRAIKRLLRLKQRPAGKGLILIAASSKQLQPYVTELRQDVLDTWPGPVTWLLPAKRNVSCLVKGKHHNIAVRVTAHKIASQLCQATGMAIISTSANQTGKMAIKTYRELKFLFGNKLDFILPGRIGRLKKPTPIYDATTREIIRQ